MPSVAVIKARGGLAARSGAAARRFVIAAFALAGLAAAGYLLCSTSDRQPQPLRSIAPDSSMRAPNAVAFIRPDKPAARAPGVCNTNNCIT